jgi:hypothetical protein
MMNVVPLDQLLPYSSRCVAVAFAYERVFEAELRESLKSVAIKKCTVALNGIVEFDMFSQPSVAAGDRIQIDLYEGWLQSGQRHKRAAHRL